MMTVCFWGGFATGKKQLLHNFKLNNKKFCLVDDYNIKFSDNICHWNGYVNEHDNLNRTSQCWDITERIKILYHGKTGLCSTYKKSRKLKFVDTFYKGYARKKKVLSILKDLVTDTSDEKLRAVEKIAMLPFSSQTLIMDDSYAKMFREDPKYQDTLCHFESLQQLPPEKWVKKKISIDDIPDCDLIIPHRNFASGYKGWERVDEQFFQQDWNRYHNIIPYKSDLVDYARNGIDLFCIEQLRYDTHNLHKHTILEDYQKHKERLWRYLDFVVFGSDFLQKTLRKAGIKFEYFNLDKDSYKKTYGLEKEFPRTFCSPTLNDIRNSNHKVTARKNYQKLTEIAEEYVASCGREDNRI